LPLRWSRRLPKTELPVTAAVKADATDTVTLTAKNAGLLGNGIDIRLNYLGVQGGESTPAGLTLTITHGGGAGAPDFVDALGNLQDKTFDFIINPYDDTASGCHEGISERCNRSLGMG
jgi:phage tail sheath gpL-like